MPRIVERVEGLALVGSAPLGHLGVRVPGLIEEPLGGADGSELLLRSEEGPVGTRHLVLGAGDAEFHLRFPVLNPEIATRTTGVFPVGDTAYLLHAPLSAEAFAFPEASRPELLVLGNARALWNEGISFLEALRELRRLAGPAPLLWAPRVALPHRIPLLVYLGVDLVDTTEGALRAAHGSYLDRALGSSDRVAALSAGVCDCPSCAARPPGPLSAHARAEYRRAIAETRAAAAQGRLRELVESRLTAEPALAEMLRYADRLLGSSLEERSPVVGSGTLGYVLAESHRRPEMLRFRARLLERYRPPRSKSVLLIVPCSRGKPYRRSRSHRRFASALDGLRAIERLHWVSVSSPIGVVPRELEDVYPACHYDIPVTGEWSEPERSTVIAGLDHLRGQGTYRSILVHLDPVEYSFLRERLPPGPDVRWTIEDDRTTSSAALASLRAAAGDALAVDSPVTGGPLAVVREELQELAAFQFGRSAAERLFGPPVRLAGRPWFQRLTDGRTDLATVREERGIFHLTVAGARRIGPPYPLAIEIDPGLPLTGDLFAPGVRAADPAIRIGDSVVLLRGGELAGVGEAALSGPLMVGRTRGLAVRVRHRVPPTTDTPIMGNESPTDDGPVV